jgi:hypothetical protein
VTPDTILRHGKSYGFSKHELGVQYCGDDAKLSLQLIEGWDRLIAMVEAPVNVGVTGISLNRVKGATNGDFDPKVLILEFRRKKGGGSAPLN